jgi:hypothetical protein
MPKILDLNERLAALETTTAVDFCAVTTQQWAIVLALDRDVVHPKWVQRLRDKGFPFDITEREEQRLLQYIERKGLLNEIKPSDSKPIE